MRKPLAVIAAVMLASTTLASGALAQPRAARAADDLARARALDKEGAKAYGEGRYNDAIRYFEEALRLGGPPFELWNIAKCHLRLDQPEQAADVLEQYLAKPNLPAEDRDEAAAQLDALRRRPSTLTVSSSPAGATVTVDGNPALGGKTPVSLSVAPGTHSVAVQSGTNAPYTRQVEARYGRAIILDVPLTLSKEPRPPPPPNPYDEAPPPPRIFLRAALALVLPRFGSIGGAAAPGLLASGAYRLADVRGTWLSVGALLALNGDTWKNRTNSANTAPGCSSPLTSANNGTALSIFALGSASWPIAERLRVAALGGVGAAAYFVDNVGGDLFVPSCKPSPGLKPALLFGAEIDYAISASVRFIAYPLTWQLQPSFEGTRSTPREASGVWMRFSLGVGIGVDL